MKHSLHYVLALSLIAAPLAATDCPEQQNAQPFYKKVGQKLWEHRNKIAITLFTVGLVAASTYVLWKAGAPQQALTTPEALVPQENTGNPTQLSSTASAVKPTETTSTSTNDTQGSTTGVALKTESAETEKSFFEKLKENGTSVVNWIIATDQAASKLTWSDVSAYSKAELSRIGQALKKGFGYTYGDAI